VSVAEHERSRARRPLGQVLALTALSALAPGTAHAVAGRKRTAVALVSITCAVAAFLLGVLVTTSRTELLRLVVQPRWLVALSVGAALLGAGWAAVIVSSYRVIRPEGMAVWRRVVATGVVGALCVVVAAPLALAARYAYVQRDLITTVFPTADVASQVDGAEHRSPSQDPWKDRRRINILLLGGDGATTREGVRTDSMTVASVDVRTGNVVLLSLPRNLQRAPLPAGPLRDTWGSHFPDLLNAVYELTTERPRLLAGTQDRGAEAIKQVTGAILGLPVDYYVLVNLAGFQKMVDALGGVTITVRDRVPIGGIAPNGAFVRPKGYIEPGRRTLDGYQALWYARSRSNTTDYDRMARQRCVLGALARQADPLNVLTRYQELASTTKQIVSTDVPRGLLPDLIELAETMRRDGDITSLQFVPPLIRTASPNYPLIRRKVRAAIAASEREARPAPSETPTAAPTPRPTRTPPPGGDSSPQRVDEVCALG
jgi:polyisoprenyl-teichoic acid--peptidoglycan teichoic acid transferase